MWKLELRVGLKQGLPVEIDLFVLDLHHVTAHANHALHEHDGRIERVTKRHNILPMDFSQRRQAKGGVGQPGAVKQLVQENVVANQDGLTPSTRWE